MISIFLLLFVPLFCQSTSGDQQPFVQLPEYGAHGFTYQYQHKNQELTSNIFLGLPYAQPPVRNLRLEKPEPLSENPQRVINNTDLPVGCTQQENMAELSPPNGDVLYPTSEDCLFLSVLTPSTPPPKDKNCPVLVWIHGGGFVYGMSSFYGWKQLARHFNSRGVVVVLIQYRVAFWGFFALGTGAGEAGNYGLWDQTAALHFINQKISKFGGDPEKVTVLGNSAGGVSTHSLSLSPHSRNYFQQTIQSSGSLYNPWSHSLKTVERSKNLTQELGCDFSNIQLTKNCLKEVSVSQIHDVLKGWERMRNQMDLLYWSPVFDQDFFAGKSISQLTQETPIRNTLYGITKGDGLIFTLNTGSVIASVFAYYLGLTVDQQANYTKADFLNHVDTYLASPEVSGPNVAEIRELLIAYYTRDSNVSNLPEKFWYTRYTDAQTDAGFAGGILVEIADKIKLGWKQHVYLVDYIHPSHRPLIGIDETYTPHAYEYQYLMDGEIYFPFQKNETNSVEIDFTEKIVDAFTSFIKTGNPCTQNVPWPAVNDSESITYLRVGEQVVAENTHFTEIAKLWRKIYDLGYLKQIFQLE